VVEVGRAAKKLNKKESRELRPDRDALIECLAEDAPNELEGNIVRDATEESR
jgi:hypothetical protein